MKQTDEWAEAEQALRDYHRDEDDPFGRWSGDVEEFVKDLMELIQAAYEGGYEDALDDVRDKTLLLSHEVEESLEYVI
jgi:hypothetical protein